MRNGSKISALILLWSIHLIAQPVINEISLSASSVGLYQKFELTVKLTAQFSNPYDFNQVNLQGEFTAPSGQVDTVDGFYYQPYKAVGGSYALFTDGAPVWKIRFTPNETGTWSFRLLLRDATGETASAPQPFDCVSSSNKGFIRQANANYFKFDDGSPYFAIGENMGWYNLGNTNVLPVEYQSWLGELSANGGNYVRVWMSSWSFGLEWNDTQLGDYKNRQNRAFQLDWLMEQARQKGVYIMLCLNNHGQVSSEVNPEWSDNPYNSANGGPCVHTWDFFTNSSAKEIYKNRLRYILARWGYSPNIFAWEHFNEVDWTDSFLANRANIVDWHNEMSQLIEALDVNEHLITSSYAQSQYDLNLWNSPHMDLTQFHHYQTSADVQSAHRTQLLNYLNNYQKPALVGEFGFNVHTGDVTGFYNENDPNGIDLHNSIWANSVSGAFGCPMTWWWDNYVHPNHLYYHFKPLANFMATVDLLGQEFKPVIIATRAPAQSDLFVSPAYGWGKSPSGSFVIYSDGSIEPPVTEMSRYLYGASWNTEHRNPPSFQINFPHTGQFKVITSANTGTAPTIQIWLDGVKKTDQPAAIKTTYNVDVPAGNHTIRIDNKGTDWIEIADYVFTNSATSLRCYSMQGGSQVFGWLQNKNYNWQTVKDQGVPDTIKSGQIKIANMKYDGIYDVQWWDCASGDISAYDSAVSSAGDFILDVPPIVWDYAFIITFRQPVNIQTADELPRKFALGQNYPNPFNAKTVISYQLSVFSEVELDVYNLIGQKVEMLISEKQAAGTYRAQWDASGLPSGIYFYRLSVDGEVVATKRMLLLK